VSGDAEVGSSVVSFVLPSAGVDVGSQLVTHPAAETSAQLAAYVAPERSSRPVISAVAKRSARVVASSARPAAEQGVRVGTLLVCGLLLILLCAGLFALRAGRMSGLRSQAAAAENARPAAVVRPQRSAAVGQAQRSAAVAEPPRSAAVASARAEPTVPTRAAVQLSAAIEPPAPPAEPNLALPVKLSTPVAAERLRSRSSGARLSSGPAAMPVMEGGPRDRRSRKPEPLPAAPEIGADPPPPAPSAPPPAATRPYRGF
jgi:hypothetical protein